MSKQGFLERLYIERVKWKALLDEVGQARMMVAGVCGMWSVRDLIAHIGIWERWGAALAQGVIEKRAMTNAELFGKEPPPYMKKMSFDRFNEWLVDQTRDKPLDEIIRMEGAIYRTFVERIEQLGDNALNKPAPQGALDGSEVPLFGELLADQSYNHYQEHGAQIRAWLANGAAE